MLRLLFLGVLAAALGYYAVFTWRWPMLVNPPIMHYVVFLMRHGLRPYADITDMNMPGAYLLERFGMLLFGGSDLGWRLYDLFLGAALMVAMVVIARPYNWLAGVYAAGLFALQHGSEGPWFLGEREQEMAVLLVASSAFLVVAVRRARPLYGAGFGLLAGMAASIKPTLAPFALVSLVLLRWTLKRRGVGASPYLLWSAGGLFVALALNLLFLLWYGALPAFLFLLRTVTPVYSGLSAPALRSLLLEAAPRGFLPLAGLAGVALLCRRQWNWERSLLLLGVLCGLLSYMIQRKGFWYQRYTFLSFALLLAGLEILPRLKENRQAWAYAISSIALLYAALHLVPRDLRVLRTKPGPSALTAAMESDLEQLGGNRLQREVQCFDITFGCLNSLYHLGLVENTGFTGDLLLFPERTNPASEYYRQLFWKLQATHPASVIVLTNQDFGHPNSFQRLAFWPAFSQWLAQNYELSVARSFPSEDRLRGESPLASANVPTYRIYLRKGQTFPVLDAALKAGQR